MRWIECLGRNITNEYEWKVDDINAGYTVEYDGITFTTVKGCGHLIPSYCPKPGFEFIQNFLNRRKK
jgi:hypothetical protein